MDSLRPTTTFRTDIFSDKSPFGGSIRRPVKSHAPRSLQIAGAGHVSSSSPASLHISNPRGRRASELGPNGSEGLGKGATLPNSIRGRKKLWWTPIFKWSSSVDNDSESDDGGRAPTAAESADVAVSEGGNGKARRATVLFTEEKARVLRREMRATESWHDLMYHSAIASRLAFPDCDSSS